MEKKLKKQYRAIVIGGTGGVGAYLVEKLLESTNYSKVSVISRRELKPSPKLNNIIWKDFSDYLINSEKEVIEVFKDHDILFCCLGSPEKTLIGLMFNKKKYEPMFQKIDYDYTVGAATLAIKAGIPNFSIVSSSGLSETGTFPYIKIKWKMEQAVKNLGFKNLSIFRPSHLMKPARAEVKIFKKLLLNIIASVASKMPHSQKAISVESVAGAMLEESYLRMNNKKDGLVFYEANDMRTLLEGNV
ncbi:MAG: NAD(P)H-binding protein [Spirochaetaceae bacterium]